MKKLVGLTLTLILMVALVLPAAAYAGKPDGAGSQNGNIEIVKKLGAKNVEFPSWWPPSSGPKPHAATGVLGEPMTGDRYAILVGISDYPGELTVLDDPAGYDLFYADNDALTMAGVLTGIYGFNPANIMLFMGPNDLTNPENTPTIQMLAATGATIETASPDNILTAIDGLPKNDDDIEVVFHFSGHGIKRNGSPASQGGGKVGMAVLNEDGSDFDFIWDSELKAAFRGFATDRIVFVFDMCLAGGMINVGSEGNVICMGTTQNGTAYEYGDAYYLDPETGEPIPEMPDPAKIIPDAPPIANGLFTYLFALVGMGGGADMMLPDGDVTVEEAFDFARFSLEAFSSGGLFYQIPTIKDRFTGDLFLGYPEEG